MQDPVSASQQHSSADPSADSSRLDLEGSTSTRLRCTSGREVVEPKIRNHNCRYCPKKFVRVEHLQRHELTHTREKPFSCNNCGKAFARKDLLIRHEKAVHTQQELSKSVIHQEDAAPIDGDWNWVLQSAAKTTRRNNHPANHEEIAGGNVVSEQTQIIESRSLDSDVPNIFEEFLSCRMPVATGASQSPRITYETSQVGELGDSLLGNDLNTGSDMVPLPQDQGAMNMRPAQEQLLDLDWMNAFDLSTTTYASGFHIAQPLWPITYTSPDSPMVEHVSPEVVSENFDHTLPKPGINHGGPSSRHQLKSSQSLFSRIFSHRASPEAENIPAQSVSPAANWMPSKIRSGLRETLAIRLHVFSHLLPEDFSLPSHYALSRYVSGYFDGFHLHLPFIHTPTWSVESCNIGLLMAMCALGARYCFEHETSMRLWKAGKAIVRSKAEERGDQLLRETRFGDEERNSHFPETSIEVIENCQAMFLLMAFSTWTGDKYLLRQALSFQSALAAMIRQDGLKQTEQSVVSWEEWIAYEGAKRIKFVVFCFFNLQCLAYNTPPLLLNDEIELDLPCSEDIWRAQNAQDWQSATTQSTTSTPKFQVMLQKLLRESTSRPKENWRQDYAYSTFGSYVLIHGLVQHTFQQRQYSRSMMGSDGSLPADQVTRLERALSQWQHAWENNPEASLNPRNPHGPLAFNCTALLRMAYVRLDIDFGPRCATLQSGDPQLVAQAMYDAPPVKRGPRLTRAALHACHALLIPVKMGIHLVAHTQVFVWSIQHSVASFECCLLLAQWLDAVTADSPSPQLSEEEKWLIRLVQETLKECDARGVENPKTLSASILRVWATVFHGTTVWGVMPLMGTALIIYANLLSDK